MANKEVQEELSNKDQKKVLLARCTKRISDSNHRMTSIYLLSLATFAIIIASSINLNDGAALNPVGKYKSPKDRGK